MRLRIEELLKQTLAPGAVVLVKSAQGKWEQAFDTRTLGGKDPVGIDDQFRVGSVTKTWTGTVILQLAQEGRLELADPISRHGKGVPNGGNITIEQLLNMRSGLFNYTRHATNWNRSWAWTAGGGISTARELAAFVERMVGGGYLQPEWQKQRLESCLPTDPVNTGPDSLHYGWGLGRVGRYYGHTGQLPGYNTYMLHNPDTRTTIIVWTSLSSGPNDRQPAIEIGNLIIAELDTQKS